MIDWLTGTGAGHIVCTIIGLIGATVVRARRIR
jgi:hypothetical protein